MTHKEEIDLMDIFDDLESLEYKLSIMLEIIEERFSRIEHMLMKGEKNDG